MPVFTSSIEMSDDYPTIRPTLDLNFAATKTLDRRITFTRDSVGTFTDKMGIVKYASNNAPRFDHDFSTGESLGLLIEESSTNISKDSEDANAGANWNQFGSISENIIEAPDGSLTADKLEAPTSGYGLVNLGASWTANVPHTFSIFAKSAEFNKIGIRIYDGTSYFARTNVNLDTGETVGGNNGAGTLKVDKFANGWWRISISGTPVSTYGYASRICVEPHNTAIVQNADPSSSKEGIYIWGWQWEQKAFPTSYIPTNGVEVTRAQDNAKITGTNFTDFYNQTEGTFFVDSAVARGSAYQGYVGSTTASTEDSGPSYNFNSIMSDGDNSDVLLNIWNGTGSAQASISIVHPTGNMRVAGAFKDNDFAISMNGSTVSTDSSGTIDTNQDQLWFGRRPYAENGYLNNSIKRISYYPKRLPDAQLQGLTQQ